MLRQALRNSQEKELEKQIDFENIIVYDSALYSRDNLKLFNLGYVYSTD